MKVNETTRNFFIGSEWCYLKIYSGPKTADLILADKIAPLAAGWLESKIIDKWFFIRYNDPKLHLRVRFHLPRPEKLGILLTGFNEACQDLLTNDLLAKIQADTYQREMERYGALTMELSESLFFFDSRLQSAMLAYLRGDQGENPRWLFCLLAIDRFLDDFGLELEARESLLRVISESYLREFGGGKGLKILLDGKFRARKKELENTLGNGEWPSGEIWPPLRDLLDQRTAAVREIAGPAKKTLAQTRQPPLEEFLISHIHMMVNRFFRTRQRAHELVLYDLLHRRYKSSLARLKYNK